MNVKKFLACLIDFYGKRFSENYGSALDSSGEPKQVWISAIGDYSNSIAGKVIEAIIENKTDHTHFVPTPGDLKRLFEIELNKLLSAKKRIESDAYLIKHEKIFGKRGFKNSVPQRFGAQQEEVDRIHEKLDETNPGWREESEKIMRKMGGKAYSEFMMKILKPKL